MQRVEFGKYIVADPNICHGKLTFKGTRIFVQDVIEMVADEMNWDVIIAEWDGAINYEAITEAVRLAGKALAEEAQRRITEKERGEWVSPPALFQGVKQQ